MYNTVVRIIAFTILFSSSIFAETRMIDVTADGVDDEIKIGEQSIIVINGANGARSTVVSGQTNLAEVAIGNYHKGSKGNEIAIVVCVGTDCWTEIYGFRDTEFVKVSDRLPGKVGFGSDSSLVCFRIHNWEGGQVTVPGPINTEGGILKALPIRNEITKAVAIEARATKDFTYGISAKTLVVCFACVEDKSVMISLRDEKGTLIASKEITPMDDFIGGGYAPGDETITLNIDNSYSILTPKTVYFVIDQYDYAPSTEEYVPVIKNNMHTVQLAVEDYSTLHEGKYPEFVVDFSALLPANFENPVEPKLPAVVDGSVGKKGQVTYSLDSKTGKYMICGFGADGKQLSLVLTN